MTSNVIFHHDTMEILWNAFLTKKTSNRNDFVLFATEHFSAEGLSQRDAILIWQSYDMFYGKKTSLLQDLKVLLDEGLDEFYETVEFDMVNRARKGVGLDEISKERLLVMKERFEFL